jgi:tetratricopeptide (TPR) repeat protein
MNLLDLCITLTEPPDSAPPETIAGFELRCDAFGLLSPNHLLTDPLSPQEREELVWYLEQYWQWPYKEFAKRGRRVEEMLEAAGKRLFQSVFGAPQAMAIFQPWNLQPNAERRISIISAVPAALSLPWELLHDEQGFLILRARQPVSIIRRLPQTQATLLIEPFTPPLRVLLVTARPEGAGFVDPRSIVRELLDEVQPQIETGTINLEFLHPPTLQALRERLSQYPPIHVLHFDGHGIFDSRGAQGKLAFENDDGNLNLVAGETLAQVLQDSGVRLAVLTACQSAKGAMDDLFSSVAAQLIRSGVDAVAAMSASVLVASATKYVEAFYRGLAAGESAPIAHERARQALHDDQRRHRHRRRRDEAGDPVKLRDWWLPHFYQQRPVSFVGQTDSLPRPNQSSISNQSAPSPEQGQTVSLPYLLPPAPRYGFTGRAYELHKIERWLMRGHVVAIHGFGGVGKTALACEAADWLMRKKFYAEHCFVPFEHGGDVTILLSALGHWLKVYDGNYDPNDVKSALAKLRPTLQQRPMLVIADNLESILPGGEAPLDESLRAELWYVLLKLAEMNCGVLLTSRDASFRHELPDAEQRVEVLRLEGLDKEDAYELASSLLDELDIDRKRTPYPELRDLLEQLNHHPLAIQLVLTAMRDESLTLSRIREDFAELLPKFVDDVETGRNRSLLASLEYSLQRLSDEHRQLLMRLAPFEGGAIEQYLLTITEIPEREWDALRSALERVALLSREQIHNDVIVPFLRFHPVLAPYLRAQPGADDQALRSRYAACYNAVADNLHHEDPYNPLARELARRELPNLRRALELLLVGGAIDEATELVNSIAYFLNSFGLWLDRDEMRRRVAQAVQAAGTHTGGALTRAEYLRESGLSEDEFASSNLRAAYVRLKTLLARVEALPAGAPFGQGSYEHCLTLGRLARCLRVDGQPAVAEAVLRRALAIIDALLATRSENQGFIRERAAILTRLADALRDQGNYAEAQVEYEASLESFKQLGDTRSQGDVQGQLGSLALRQGDYVTARQRYQEALKLDQELDEPLSKAVDWHQLGRVAGEQEDWAEAERCYRASLEIKEWHGDAAGAARTYNQLAIVAENSGRPAEAEEWYKRALNVPDLQPTKVASRCNNLADLLTNEVRAGRMPPERLAEARGYAERALKIRETLDASSEIWMTQGILADIAELEGERETARAFRRSERESFAAFAGNRWHIDTNFGDLVADIVAACHGDEQTRAKVEGVLPQLEGEGAPVDAIRCIWAGERDWHALAEDLNPPQSLLVLLVLETITENSSKEKS